jgi:predicted DNA-binding transcriptional regulator YafY
MAERLCFAYEHRYRVLDDWTVRVTKDRNVLLVGVDPDKGEFRSFRVDRIKGRIRRLAPAQRVS